MKTYNQKFIFISLILLILQITIFKNIALGSYGFSFIYVGILLLIPLEFPVLLSMVIGFLLGLFIDVFYDTLGLNAAACLTLMFARYYLLKVFTPRSANENQILPLINEVGGIWVIAYSSILIFIHHLVLFGVENPTFHSLGYTLLKVLFSSVLTLFFYVSIHYLVFNQKHKRK